MASSSHEHDYSSDEEAHAALQANAALLPALTSAAPSGGPTRVANGAVRIQFSAEELRSIGRLLERSRPQEDAELAALLRRKLSLVPASPSPAELAFVEAANCAEGGTEVVTQGGKVYSSMDAGVQTDFDYYESSDDDHESTKLLGGEDGGNDKVGGEVVVCISSVKPVHSGWDKDSGVLDEDDSSGGALVREENGQPKETNSGSSLTYVSQGTQTGK